MRAASVVALEACELLEFDTVALVAYCDRHPDDNGADQCPSLAPQIAPDAPQRAAQPGLHLLVRPCRHTACVG